MGIDVILTIVIVSVVILVLFGGEILGLITKKAKKKNERSKPEATEGLTFVPKSTARQQQTTTESSQVKQQRAVVQALPKAQEKHIKDMLEEGMYEKALGLKYNSQPPKIKSKIIELRENSPELSSLLVEAEDALIRNLKQHKKDSILRDNIRDSIEKKWGKVALELFPGKQLWRIIKDKPQLGKDVPSFIMEEVGSIVKHLPALEISRGQNVSVTAYRLDCNVCHGGKDVPDCPLCDGKGFLPPSRTSRCSLCEGSGEVTISKLRSIWDTFGKISKSNVGYSYYSPKTKCPICEGTGHIDDKEVCTICNGSGKYCACGQKASFKINPQARVGMVIKAEESSENRPIFARLV